MAKIFPPVQEKKWMASYVVPVGQTLASGIFQTCGRSSAGSGQNYAKGSANSYNSRAGLNAMLWSCKGKINLMHSHNEAYRTFARAGNRTPVEESPPWALATVLYLPTFILAQDKHVGIGDDANEAHMALIWLRSCPCLPVSMMITMVL